LDCNRCRGNLNGKPGLSKATVVRLEMTSKKRDLATALLEETNFERNLNNLP
jgi:hypothetical protein